jgi:glutamate/tyrosine decarboxylase-like PLP-dependent enzyme
MTPSMRSSALEPSRARDVLEAASRLAEEYLAGLAGRRVAPHPADVTAALCALGGELPDRPTDPTDVVERLARYGALATTATAGGRFFGLVVGGSTPAALGARVLTAAWDQVVFNDAISPIGCGLERIALGWLTNLLGLPAEAHATTITGATMGNFTCLAAARHALLTRAGHDVRTKGVWGAPRVRVVASREAHVTVVKALTLLGWGSDDLEVVACDAQGRLIADQLPPLDDRTIVCVQAGNVNSGAVDPLREICEHARAAGAWVHVDGAFGLWAAAAPSTRHLVRGLALADSWVTDAHKWLNCPYDSGVAIVRDAESLHAAMATQAPYLSEGAVAAPKDMGPEFSRGARGIELWAALAALGRDGVAELIERSCAQARALAAGLANAGFEILNDVVLNQVVAVPPAPERVDAIVSNVQAGGECWLGPSVWQGRRAMRLSVSSYATTDDDIRRTLRAIVAAAGDADDGMQS